MAKIPFDIKFKPQIESGEYKVETKDGREVRIISWDKSGFECTEIVALVKCATGTDNCNIYTIDGLLRSNCYQDNMKLVVITPEPELSEWQTFISGCLQKYGLLDCGAADRIAKESSVELLDLARKELVEEQYTSDPRKTDLYKLGKVEALKDLPRWRKWGNGACCNGRGIPIAIVKRRLNGYELVDALGISGEQYIMLSDLEKLPGFKEDSHE